MRNESHLQGVNYSMILKHCLVHSEHLWIPVRCQQGGDDHCTLVQCWCYFLIDFPAGMQFISLLCQCNPNNFSSPAILKDNRFSLG